MGRLGERVGSFEALAFAAVITAALAVLLLLLVRRSLDGFAQAAGTPVWLWLGGALSAFIVFTITFSSPRIGVTATIAILIAGQLAMGLAIDRWGLFGLERIATAWPRLLGVALVALGAALTLRR